MTSHTPPPARHTELLTVCRLLADHLGAYAISATTYDEDAVIALERAERLLADHSVAASHLRR